MLWTAVKNEWRITDGSRLESLRRACHGQNKRWFTELKTGHAVCLEPDLSWLRELQNTKWEPGAEPYTAFNSGGMLMKKWIVVELRNSLASSDEPLHRYISKNRRISVSKAKSSSFAKLKLNLTNLILSHLFYHSESQPNLPRIKVSAVGSSLHNSVFLRLPIAFLW